MNAPLEVTEQRDPKGLYRRARAGLISSKEMGVLFLFYNFKVDFTGIDSPYEIPLEPELSLASHLLTVEECTQVSIMLTQERASRTLNLASKIKY